MGYKSKGFLGDGNVGVFKLGDSDVKIYLGEMLVYPLGPNITCDSAVYNGTLQVAQNIVVEDESGNTLVENIDYVITENSGGINAGSYSLVATLMGAYQGTISTEFVINKVTPTVIEPTPKVLTYNGSPQELVNAGSTDYGTLKYSLDNSTWSTSVPTATNYGSYTVYYKVDGDNNINDVATQSIACSINEKQVTATVELNPSIYTYNGYHCEPNVTVKDGSTIIDPSEYTVTFSNNVNAGTATVTISDNVGGNYDVIGSAIFTINKASGSVTIAPTAKNLTYNGNNQELVNAGRGTGTMLYKLGGDSWSTDIPSATTAGTYTVYYKASASTNYEESSSGSVNCTIVKADSLLSFTLTDIIVGLGETTSNIVTVNAGDGIVTYTSNDASVVSADNNGSISGVSIGNTSVVANISSTNNYNSATTNYSASCLVVVTAKFDVTIVSFPTTIASGTTGFSAIEIDGVKQKSLITSYTFNTKGEHVIKYALIDPTNIGDKAFYGCSRMTSVTIPDSVTSINDSAFTWCSLTNIDIPNSVTSIGDSAFDNCRGLTSIDIPNSVTSIGNWAFYNCYTLTSATIGSSVTNIGEGAFYRCRSLTGITIPDSVTSIDDSTFYGCSGLTSVTIGSGVTSIGTSAFTWCSGLTSVVIPDNVITIGSHAFTYCHALTSCTIGSGVTSISDNTFQSCNRLASVTIGSSVTSIGNSAFIFCHNLTSIDIPNSVTSIGNSAFENCMKLSSCTIGSGVTSIGYNAFYFSNNITSIVIPASVTSIGERAFGCSGLTSITSLAMTAPTIHYTTFAPSQENGILYVPIGSSGYDVWMLNDPYYLGWSKWTKVEQ